MCCFRLSCLSSKTPRYLIFSASLISVLLMFIDFVMHLSSWGFGPKRMNSVLSLFILSWFLSIHTFRSTAHFFNSNMHLTSPSQWPGLNLLSTVWPSATPCRLRGGFITPCIVLQYKLKVCAPAQDPWGTLKERFHSNEYSFPMLTLQLLGCRYDSNQLCMYLLVHNCV